MIKALNGTVSSNNTANSNQCQNTSGSRDDTNDSIPEIGREKDEVTTNFGKSEFADYYEMEYRQCLGDIFDEISQDKKNKPKRSSSPACKRAMAEAIWEFLPYYNGKKHKMKEW